MSLSKIQRHMLDNGSVLPENLITTATYTVAGLTATNITATTGNITTVNATTLAASGNASAVHITASGNLVAAAARATTITATNLIATSETVGTLTATTATINKLTVTSPVAEMTITSAVVSSLYGISISTGELSSGNVNFTGSLINTSGGAFKVENLRSSTSTTVVFYNSSTKELSYAPIASLIPSAYDQSLNTTNVVTFAGVTATSITVGGVQQTSAWTGTVANSQITSVSTSKVTGLSTIGFTGKLSDGIGNISTSTVTGLSTVGYTNQYADLTGKPSLATVATSGNYNDLSNKPTSWSTSSITGLSTVGYTNKYTDLDQKPTDQNLFTTSTATFKNLVLPFDLSGGGNITVGGSVYTTDINSTGTHLYLDAVDAVVPETDIWAQGDIRPYWTTAQQEASASLRVSLGTDTNRWWDVNSRTASFTSTVYIEDLYPWSGGSSWAAAAGNIGDTNRRWSSIWVKTINAQTTITGGALVVDSVQFTGNSSIQTTAWTGTVAASNVSGLATVATSGAYSDLTGRPNQSLDTTSNPTFNQLTISTTATAQNIWLSNVPYSAAGSSNAGLFVDVAGGGKLSWSYITTSTVAGLSTVAWTGLYSDLIGEPNQALDTTSIVQFGGITDTGNLSVSGMTNLSGLTVSTGTVVQKTLTAGGYPLNSAGTASVFLSTGSSPSAVISNYVAGTVPNMYLRGYGQNRPGGISTTGPGVAFTMEGSRGTQAAPTAIVSGDVLGGFSAGGFDGNNWMADYSQATNYIGWYATETWGYDATATTSTIRAGSGFHIYAQPGWTRTGINQSRQRFVFTNWTTSTVNPSQLNLFIGSQVEGTTASHILANGTSVVGPGRTNLQFVNALTTFLGVPSTDTSADNATFTATNIINLVGNRRSGGTSRRLPLVSGDTLYSLSFRGQSGSTPTGVGLQGAAITATALDNFTATAYGTSLSLSTVNVGSSTSRTRLSLSNLSMAASADQYTFLDGNQAFTALTLSTSTAAFLGGVSVGGLGVTYPDLTTQNTAWKPAYISAYDTTLSQTTATTTGLNIVQINSVSTASDVTLVSSGLRVTNAGVYNLQFSIQFENTSASAEDVVIWLRQNSTDLSNSSGVVSVVGQHGGVNGKAIASWNYILPAAANDTFYLMWQPQNTAVGIYTQNVGTGTPQAPGVIVTVVRER